MHPNNRSVRRSALAVGAVLALSIGLLGACGGGHSHHDDHGDHAGHAPGGTGQPPPTAGEGSAKNPVDAPVRPRPDIVVVVADDMRWDLMSGEGHPFLDTPNLDRFANEAAKMNAAFVPVPICSPSRASILTGREPHRASAPGILWRNNSFLQTQRTLAEDLQDAGYTTAYFGKWHMGDGAIPKRGFDHWESFDWLGEFFDPTVHVNGVRHEFDGYVDDVLSARAERFLKEHANSDKPVFMMIGLKAPHLMFEHPERHDHAFDGVGIPVPENYEEDFSITKKLQAIKDRFGMLTFSGGLRHYGDWDNYIKEHYRAILGLDDSVGTLRAALRHRGKEDDTLFVYTSDNGYSLGEHGMTEKHTVYEEPTRVPFLIDFPGQDDRGFRFDGLVSTLDIAPTALDYAGVPVPERMDGRSLRPLVEPGHDVKGERDLPWRDEIFLAYEDWHLGLRTERYKYVESLLKDKPDHVELYDLLVDPNEMHTVHADPEYAETLRTMKERLARAKESREWTPRSHYPLHKVLVSSPVQTVLADSVARTVSLGRVPSPGTADASGLSWSVADRGPDGFSLGDDVPAGSSVFIALPLERLTDFDPFVRIEIGGFVPKGTGASMYVGGEPLWDNFERRPMNFINPPQLEPSTLVVMRLDNRSGGAMRAGMGLKAPDDTVRLPLENRHLGDEPMRFTSAER